VKSRLTLASPYPLPPIPPLARPRAPGVSAKSGWLNLHELTAAFGVSERTIRQYVEPGHVAYRGGVQNSEGED
jgi:hypothetical protein